jgi:hypothetical protein
MGSYVRRIDGMKSQEKDGWGKREGNERVKAGRANGGVLSEFIRHVAGARMRDPV